MPGRQTSLASVRDALLVVMVATLAFALGAVAPGLEVGETAIPVIGDLRGDSRIGGGEPATGPGASFRSLAPVAPDRADTAIDRPRLAPAPVPTSVPTPARAATIPAQRFMGDGAGRREHIVASDPHSRRSYILDTASLLHRRGWIGLDGRVAGAFAPGIDNSARPAAQRGPE